MRRGCTWTSRPISALAIAVVFAPFVVAGSIAGFEIVHPMAVVVLGGLVTTTVLTLFVVPVLYLRFGSGSDRDTWTDELFAPAPEEQKAAPAEARTSMMQRFRPAIAALPLIPVLLLAGCAGAVADKYTIEHEPASVASIAGTNQVQVRLGGRAAQRLGIQTT